ncbi:hypothetical protein [Streptomyces sp. NPDC007369]
MTTTADHVRLAAPPDTEDRLRTFHTHVLGMSGIPDPPAPAAAP